MRQSSRTLWVGSVFESHLFAEVMVAFVKLRLRDCASFEKSFQKLHLFMKQFFVRMFCVRNLNHGFPLFCGFVRDGECKIAYK